MVPVVYELFAAGLAASTLKSYTSGQRRYARFCVSVPISPYPTSEGLLCQFVARLYVDGLAAGTVKSYLAAVRHAQIGLGLGDPHMAEMPQLEYVVKGFRRRAAQGGGRPRLPVTPGILRSLKGVWSLEPDGFTASMLWAAVCLCFFGFLRSGEVVVPSDSGFDPTVHLCFEDISVDSCVAPASIQVFLKASKTDPFRKGVSLVIGKGSPELCPVAAVLDYMVRRGNATGPLFQFRDGRFLTRARFVAAVRSALVKVGLDARLYSGHSFRIGAATTAAFCGIYTGFIDQDAGTLAEFCLHIVCAYPPSCASRHGRTSLC